MNFWRGSCYVNEFFISSQLNLLGCIDYWKLHMVSESTQGRVFELWRRPKKCQAKKLLYPKVYVGELQTATGLDSRGGIRKIYFSIPISLSFYNVLFIKNSYTSKKKFLFFSSFLVAFQKNFLSWPYSVRLG